MKLAIPILFAISLLGALAYFALEGARRRGFDAGFDAGRAATIRQIQTSVQKQDTQWVSTGPPVFEYTNRFITNWTLRVPTIQ